MRLQPPPVSLSCMVRFSFYDEEDRPIPALCLETGEEIWGGWWYPNLITDAGLDAFATTNSIPSGAPSSGLPRSNAPGIRSNLGIGTGSLEVKRPSGAITLSQSGNTVTASGAFFQSGDVGAEIVWDNATRAKITAFTSATQVTVADSKTVAAAAATLWAVQLTALPGEVQVGSSDGGFIGSANLTEDASDFILEVTIPTVITLSADQNLTGFRFGSSASIGGTAHIIENFRDGSGNPITVSLLSGKKVRVDHKMIWKASKALTSGLIVPLKDYDAANNLTGTTNLTVDYKIRAPSSPPGYMLFNQLLNPPATGTSFTVELADNTDTMDSTAWNGQNTSNSLASYTNGSFKRIRTYTIAEADGVGTWYGFALAGDSSNVGNKHAVRAMLQGGASFTKSNTQQLAFDLELSWQREYV